MTVGKALPVLFLFLLLGGAALIFPLRSAPPEAGAAVLGPTRTPTPIPWDDIQVAPPEIVISASLTNEALAVAGENVYVVSSSAEGGVYFSRSTDGGHTFFPPVLVAFPGFLASLARREGAPPEELDLYVVFEVSMDDGIHVAFTRSPDGEYLDTADFRPRPRWERLPGCQDRRRCGRNDLCHLPARTLPPDPLYRRRGHLERAVSLYP